MRKFLIPMAAVSALAVAAPAAAQWAPAPPVPYGNAYGYNNWGQVRALQVRVNQIQRQIHRLDRRDRIGNREADRLNRQAERIEQRLRMASRNGLNPYEANDIQRRIVMLEQRVNYAASNGWNRYGRNFGWNDRDRDGRDDRYEDDRGRRHDD